MNVKETILIKLNSVFVPPDASQIPARRHDLDWLRIILFALLIVHHIGMFYVENWGWHAKSQYNFQWLESVLLIVEPWRMPAIWFISGIAIRFVLAKVDVWRYITLRSYRLLLPLLFGILVVVPPQLYIEMTSKAEISMSYWQFLQAFFHDTDHVFFNYTSGIWPHIDVNHLWYLRSLWYYSLCLLLLMPLINCQTVKHITDWLANKHGLVMLMILAIPILLIQVFWPMETTRYPIGFTFLLYGYLLGWHPKHWQNICCASKKLSMSYLLISALFIGFYNIYWLDVLHEKQVSKGVLMMGMALYAIARVTGLLMVLSFTKFLAKNNSNTLQYLNDAVFPFYILHQSIIIVVGYYFTQHSMGALTESLLVIMTTITLCFIGFELIRKTEFLRPFFGLKLQKNYSKRLTKLGYLICALALSPLAIRLI